MCKSQPSLQTVYWPCGPLCMWVSSPSAPQSPGPYHPHLVSTFLLHWPPQHLPASHSWSPCPSDKHTVWGPLHRKQMLLPLFPTMRTTLFTFTTKGRKTSPTSPFSIPSELQLGFLPPQPHWLPVTHLWWPHANTSDLDPNQHLLCIIRNLLR
jgi:hypothetical protein